MKTNPPHPGNPAVLRVCAAISPRLEKCFQAGCLQALFPLLASWPEPELRMLRRDVARFYRLAAQEIEDAYRHDVLQPRALGDRVQLRQIHESYREARLQCIVTVTEIMTAIRFFLDVRYYAPEEGMGEKVS